MKTYSIVRQEFKGGPWHHLFPWVQSRKTFIKGACSVLKSYKSLSSTQTENWGILCDQDGEIIEQTNRDLREIENRDFEKQDYENTK